MDKDRTVALLTLHEAERQFAYDDKTGKPVRLPTGGKVTIGIGRNVDAAGGKGLTRDEIAYLLSNDIEECRGWLALHLPWFNGLSDVRKAILLDMRFNLGPTRFATFKNTLALVSVGRYHDAAAQMLQSKWAGQVGKRALRLSEMMKTGEWPTELTN
jgi:lysozyme